MHTVARRLRDVLMLKVRFGLFVETVGNVNPPEYLFPGPVPDMPSVGVIPGAAVEPRTLTHYYNSLTLTSLVGMPVCFAQGEDFDALCNL